MKYSNHMQSTCCILVAAKKSVRNLVRCPMKMKVSPSCHFPLTKAEEGPQMHFWYAAAATAAAAGCHRFPTGAAAQQQHHHLHHHQCCCCCWLDTQSIVLFYFVLCLLVSCFCFCCVFFFYAYYKSVSLSLSLCCCRAASSHFGQIFRYLWLFSSVQFKFASRAVWVLCRRVDRVVIRSCKG